MTHRLLIDIHLPLSALTLSIRWETPAVSAGIFGPSGAGKTTILETVAGLRREVRGVIRVAGRTWLDSSRALCLPPEERGVGYVPQDTLLFPHRDVMGNLMSGRRRLERAGSGGLSPQRVLEVLELGPLRDRDVSSLSGGERQRVALGRALCSGAGLLLLDEPLAGLDLPLRRRLLPYLFRVREEFRIPMLYVSHDAIEIRTLCDEVLVVRSGRAEASGRAEEVFARLFPVTADDGHDNVLRGKIVETRGSSACLELEPDVRLVVPAQGLAPGQDVVVGLKSEDLILATAPPSGLSAQNVLAAQVLEIRAPGEEAASGPVVVVLGLGRARRPLLATITEESRRRLAIRPGQPIHVVCKTQSCRILATH